MYFVKHYYLLISYFLCLCCDKILPTNTCSVLVIHLLFVKLVILNVRVLYLKILKIKKLKMQMLVVWAISPAKNNSCSGAKTQLDFIYIQFRIGLWNCFHEGFKHATQSIFGENVFNIMFLKVKRKQRPTLLAKEVRRSRGPGKSYAIYAYKVLKQVRLETRISSKSMSIMNLFVRDIFQHIVASHVAYYRHSTITSWEM